MKEIYDADYWERGIETGKSLYTNYRWIAELTIPLAARIIEYLKIKEDETIIDFGCGKGYLVKALRLLHRNAFGFDISEYAIFCVPEDVKDYIFFGKQLHLYPKRFDWLISKDTVEHISYEEIDNEIRFLHQISEKIFIIVPLGKEGKFIIPAYELDKTHKIRESLEWWIRKINDCGFETTDARYNVKHIKENWGCFEKGNGFITAIRKGE